MKRTLLTALAVLLSVLLAGCSFGNTSRKELNRRFDSYQSEVVEVVPYVYLNTLVFGDVSIDFDAVLKNNGCEGTFHEVYVVQGDTVWFGYADVQREGGVGKWNIATVATDGTGFAVHYNGEFGESDTADTHYVQANIGWDGQNDNGWYEDGKIVMTDRVKTVAFDLQTSQVEEYEASDYPSPTKEIEAERLDYQTLSFTKDGLQKTLNITKAGQSSAVFDDLSHLAAEKNWEGVSCLSALFDSVQVVGDEIYVFCRVLNWDGETHSLVFQYDYETNSLRFVFHRFTNDLILRRLYVVPN